MDIVVGGGRYGCEAIKRLKRQQRCFVVVDVDSNCLAIETFKLKTCTDCIQEGDCFVQGDLTTVLALTEQLKPEYIYPTAPIHIAAEMAKTKFRLQPWTEIVNCILARLPASVVLSAGRGKIALSYNRDSDCIQKCAMPKVCPSTETKKPCTMHSLMQYAYPDGYILQSYPNEPGLGALKGCEVAEFLNWAGQKDRFVVGTSCDCHGVFSALKKA